jgi:hypothetical protein
MSREGGANDDGDGKNKNYRAAAFKEDDSENDDEAEETNNVSREGTMRQGT